MVPPSRASGVTPHSRGEVSAGSVRHDTRRALGELFNEGTFDITAFGFTVDLTGEVYFSLAGNIVNLQFPFLNGTSNDVFFEISGVPDFLIPARTHWLPCSIQTGATTQQGFMLLPVLTGGNIALAPSEARNTGGWSGAGNKSLLNTTVTYSIRG